MFREAWNALIACVLSFILCAVAYPAAVYLIGHTLFPSQAEGSLIERDGKVIGSRLIAQPFASDTYFQPRPSAAGANGYAADAASGSNLATTNPALHDAIEARAKALGATPENPVPVDLVMASGAGLDPEVSPEAAKYQAARVAKARGIAVEKIQALIEAQTDTSGAIIGAPARVNVLLLNLELDKQYPAPVTTPTVTPTAPPVETPIPKAEVEKPATTAVIASTPAPTAKPDSRVEELSRRVEELHHRRNDPEIAGELKGLKERLDGIAHKAEEAAKSTARVGEIDDKVIAVGREVAALKAEPKPDAVPNPAVVELGKQVRELRDELATLRNSAGKERAFAQVADTYRSKKYADAATAAKALTAKYPDDARGWYFAAIANGFSTSQWKGETEDLVNKGVERERAGTPPAGEIDAVFAELTTESGKDWLAFHRNRAAKR